MKRAALWLANWLLSWVDGTSFESYLRTYLDRSVVDHNLRASKEDGKVVFYIHPDGVDGDTPDFIVRGNILIPDTSKQPVHIRYAAEGEAV